MKTVAALRMARAELLRIQKGDFSMYTMMQICKEADMTYQTLKYYCNEGLIPNVKRDKNNRRVFDDKDLKWIKDLVCLKKCGMSIQEMKEYLDLCLQGELTIHQRKAMLDKKRKALLDSIEELKGCVDYIDWKQNFYDEVLSGETLCQQSDPDGRIVRPLLFRHLIQHVVQLMHQFTKLSDHRFGKLSIMRITTSQVSSNSISAA